MVGDAKLQANDGGDPSAGPELAPEAIGFGTTVQEVGQARELLGGQAAGAPQREADAGGPRGPPSRARVIHWLTAASLTPKASAIWRCDQPCCLRCQAWNRRASFQLCGVGFMHDTVPEVCPEVKLLMFGSVIKFRWKVAGGDNHPFDDGALEAMFKYSKGLPRKILKIADNALIRAMSEELRTINRQIIDQVASEVRLTDEFEAKQVHKRTQSKPK